MLNLEQIETFYPENMRIFKRNLLREYLQYVILDIIYSSGYGSRLIFMGGTAIHMIHGVPQSQAKFQSKSQTFFHSWKTKKIKFTSSLLLDF
jgi:hypothetical protein